MRGGEEFQAIGSSQSGVRINVQMKSLGRPESCYVLDSIQSELTWPPLPEDRPGSRTGQGEEEMNPPAVL
eukprot:3865729-Karenia_brevis.AAC.1